MIRTTWAWRPPRPSLYRSTSARPPRDSICQLVSGTRLTPGPRSVPRPLTASSLCISLSPHLPSVFSSLPFRHLSFSLASPRAPNAPAAPIPAWFFHVVGYVPPRASARARALSRVARERFQGVQSDRDAKEGWSGERERGGGEGEEWMGRVLQL